MKNPLLARLKKTSTIEETDILTQSTIFNVKDMITTAIPAINIALSGDIDGGLLSGLTLWAGPSKHFKSMFSLIMAKSYMDKYPESILLFYDSEFGTPQAYFESLGIDMERVLHTPIANIEELKHDVMAQLDELKKTDKIIIVADSIGNLASKKEVDDALEGKSVADMTRAKQLKSLFRMITPTLTIKDIPFIAVMHTYQTQEIYSKAVVSGGSGPYYSASSIFILGRQQDKQGTDLNGYHFIINVEKSRHVKEKSKIPISVSFSGGLDKWTGLLDIALEGNFVCKPSNGWYSKVDPDTGEISDKKVREKDTHTAEFWNPILSNQKFKDYVKNKYQVGAGNILQEDDVQEDQEVYNNSLAVEE